MSREEVECTEQVRTTVCSRLQQLRHNLHLKAINKIACIAIDLTGRIRLPGLYNV